MTKLHKNSVIRNKQLLKFISNRVKLKLLNAHKVHPMNKSFKTSFICNSLLRADKEKKKLTSKYCKQRFCLTCNRIRTAKFLNDYSAPIKAMKDAQFVTLTRKSVLDKNLPLQMNLMYSNWRKIANKAARKKMNFQGIRKAECNLRPGGKSHFHFHIIVDGKEQAEWLVAQWLELNGKKYTSLKAQDIRPVDDGAIKEIGKYFSKMSIKGQNNTDYKRLATLLYQMKGKRTYQSFGGFKAVKLEEEEITDDLVAQDAEIEITDEYYEWIKDFNNWYGTDTGVQLSPYNVNEKALSEWKLEQEDST